MYTICVPSALGDHMRALNSLELECELPRGYWKLNLGPSARAASALNSLPESLNEMKAEAILLMCSQEGGCGQRLPQRRVRIGQEEVERRIKMTLCI